MTQKAAMNDVVRILDQQIEQHLQSPNLAIQLPPLMLWGPPGIGKSSVVRERCRQKNIGFLDIRLSQREPVDLRGLPVPREDRVDWLLSGEWPRDPQSSGVILFDELTAADRSLQVAAYELILDRRLGDLYELPPGWMVVAAGNRTEDRAVAGMLSSALANRFCHLEMDANLEDWFQWASVKGLHPDVIAFLRFRPESFFSMEGDVEKGWPSPRSWERVSHVLDQIRDALPESALNLMVEGLVGKGAATEFLAFRDQTTRLPDMDAMLDGQAPVQVPERADQRYAFATTLARLVWPNATAIRSNRLDGFFRISRELPSDFATLALLDLVEAPDATIREQRIQAVFGHPDFAQWTQLHGTVFGEHYRAQEAQRCA